MEGRGLVRSADSGQGTWNRGVREEKVSLHGDLVPGTSVRVVDGPRVRLDAVIQLRPSACLEHIKTGMARIGRESARAGRCCAPGALPGTPGAQWPADEQIGTRLSQITKRSFTEIQPVPVPTISGQEAPAPICIPQGNQQSWFVGITLGYHRPCALLTFPTSNPTGLPKHLNEEEFGLL